MEKRRSMERRIIINHTGKRPADEIRLKVLRLLVQETGRGIVHDEASPEIRQYRDIRQDKQG